MPTYADIIGTATFLMAFVIVPGVGYLHRQNQKAWTNLHNELKHLSRRQKRHDRRQQKQDRRINAIESRIGST